MSYHELQSLKYNFVVKVNFFSTTVYFFQPFVDHFQTFWNISLPLNFRLKFYMNWKNIITWHFYVYSIMNKICVYAICLSLLSLFNLHFTQLSMFLLSHIFLHYHYIIWCKCEHPLRVPDSFLYLLLFCGVMELVLAEAEETFCVSLWHGLKRFSKAAVLIFFLCSPTEDKSRQQIPAWTSTNGGNLLCQAVKGSINL